MGLNRQYRHQPSQEVIKRLSNPQSAKDWEDALNESCTPYYQSLKNQVENQRKDAQQANVQNAQVVGAVMHSIDLEQALIELLKIQEQDKYEREEFIKKAIADANLTQQKVNEETVLLGKSLIDPAAKTATPVSTASKIPDYVLSQLAEHLVGLRQQMVAVQASINSVNAQIQTVNQQWQQRRQALNTQLVNAVQNGTVTVYGINGQPINAAAAATSLQRHFDARSQTPLSTKLEYSGINKRIREQEELEPNFVDQTCQTVVRYENAVHELGVLFALSNDFGLTMSEVRQFQRNNKSLFDSIASGYTSEVVYGVEDVKNLAHYARSQGMNTLLLIGLKKQCGDIEKTLESGVVTSMNPELAQLLKEFGLNTQAPVMTQEERIEILVDKDHNRHRRSNSF